ncbi:hypothetical protein C8E87_7996 [Paractinoplanes brasiliensis]|uniref:Uncharacterized protein n=1 Tax=Paractinoplanes brasiliensis TaxID=52695 RepID=A0A4R6JC86_9ACTN|nr:hypothetical protein C8E87_7996 [Actinoplanes brasiliensis]
MHGWLKSRTRGGRRLSPAPKWPILARMPDARYVQSCPSVTASRGRRNTPGPDRAARTGAAALRLALVAAFGFAALSGAEPAHAAPTPNVDSGFGAGGVVTVPGRSVDTTVDASGRIRLLTTDDQGVTRLTTLTPDGMKEHEAVVPFAGLLATGSDGSAAVVATAPTGIRVHRVGGATTTALDGRPIEAVRAVTVRRNGTLIVQTPHVLVAIKPDGSLDPSWSGDGVVETTEDIRAITATGDHLLTATSTSIVRYSPGGAPETVRFTLPAGFDPYGLSPAFVSGRSANRMAVVKLLPTGAPDPTYGMKGLAVGAAHDCAPAARRAFPTSAGATAIGECEAGLVHVQQFTAAGTDAGELVVDQAGTQRALGDSGGGPQPGDRTIVTFASEGSTTSVVRLLPRTVVPAYVPITPGRLLAPTRVGPGKEVDVIVRGTNASAVAIDVAVARGSAPGGVLAYPKGTKPPAVATNLHSTGQSVTQRIVVPFPKNGRITLRNASSGPANLAANLVGWYRAGAYLPVTPTRVLAARGLKAHQAITFAVAGRAGVPATARTVLVNLSVNGVTSAGSLKLSPASRSVLASHGPGRPGNATTRVTLGTGGRMTVVNNAPTSANVTVDVVGYLKS